jgi:hypothetical protein
VNEVARSVELLRGLKSIQPFQMIDCSSIRNHTLGPVIFPVIFNRCYRSDQAEFVDSDPIESDADELDGPELDTLLVPSVISYSLRGLSCCH